MMLLDVNTMCLLVATNNAFLAHLAYPIEPGLMAAPLQGWLVVAEGVRVGVGTGVINCEARRSISTRVNVTVTPLEVVP